MSEACSCIYTSAKDGDPPVYYDATMRKARKVHKCTECSGEIKPGTKYEDARGKWDDGPETFKTCSDCMSIRECFFCNSVAHTMIWALVGEHIVEMNGKVLCDGVADLTPRAKEMLFKRIEAYWAKHPDKDE